MSEAKKKKSKPRASASKTSSTKTLSARGRRNKGKVGEREFIKLVEAATGITLTRNLNQSHQGGYDLDGIDELAIEVKRQERLAIKAWWAQACLQSRPDQYPVLAYRQSRQPWTVIVTNDWATNEPPTDNALVKSLTLDDFCKMLIDRYKVS